MKPHRGENSKKYLKPLPSYVFKGCNNESASVTTHPSVTVTTVGPQRVGYRVTYIIAEADRVPSET